MGAIHLSYDYNTHPLRMRRVIVLIAAICYLTVSLASVSEFSDEETILKHGEPRVSYGEFTHLVEKSARATVAHTESAAHRRLQKPLAKARRAPPSSAQQIALHKLHPIVKNVAIKGHQS